DPWNQRGTRPSCIKDLSLWLSRPCDGKKSAARSSWNWGSELASIGDMLRPSLKPPASTNKKRSPSFYQGTSVIFNFLGHLCCRHRCQYHHQPLACESIGATRKAFSLLVRCSRAGDRRGMRPPTVDEQHRFAMKFGSFRDVL